MANNRKNQSAAVRFGPALKALLVCAAVGGAGVGYVWHVQQLHLLWRKIVEGEKRLEALVRENREWEKQLSYLKSPAVLKSLVSKHNLNLGMTHPDQVLVLLDPMQGSGALAAGAQLVQSRSAVGLR